MKAQQKTADQIPPYDPGPPIPLDVMLENLLRGIEGSLCDDTASPEKLID